MFTSATSIVLCPISIQPISVLQKRAICVIYNLGPKESLRQKFKGINILTVASQYIFENVMYVKKNINNFTKIGDVHNINTRNRLKPSAPVRTARTRLLRIRNFLGQCVRFYNRIPENVREFSISRFKKK